MAWIVGAGMAVGAAASLYGAKKQSDAMDDATAANQQSSRETNALNWAMKMYDKGVGQDGTAVNTKLPVWATVDIDGQGNIVQATPIRKGQTYDNSLPQAATGSAPASHWTANSNVMKNLGG